LLDNFYNHIILGIGDMAILSIKFLILN